MAKFVFQLNNCVGKLVAESATAARETEADEQKQVAY